MFELMSEGMGHVRVRGFEVRVGAFAGRAGDVDLTGLAGASGWVGVRGGVRGGVKVRVTIVNKKGESRTTVATGGEDYDWSES